MKTLASALIGFSLMVGTVVAQTPAPSNTTKVKKSKKHAAAKTNKAAPAASTTAPAK